MNVNKNVGMIYAGLLERTGNRRRDYAAAHIDATAEVMEVAVVEVVVVVVMAVSR